MSLQAFELDISKELQAYEVEYHVFSEEMLYSPRPGPQHAPGGPGSGPGSGSGHPAVVALQHTVRRLRQQNLELAEKLQRAHSAAHTLQMAAAQRRLDHDRHQSRIDALELERSALLATVANLKRLIPQSQQDAIPRMLQMQSLSPSPAPSPSPSPSPAPQCTAPPAAQGAGQPSNASHSALAPHSQAGDEGGGGDLAANSPRHRGDEGGGGDLAANSPRHRGDPAANTPRHRGDEGGGGDPTANTPRHRGDEGGGGDPAANTPRHSSSPSRRD